MKPLATLLLLLTHPLVVTSRSVLAELQIDRQTGQVSTEIWDPSYSRLHARSCRPKIDTGDFYNYPISFLVDDQGRGTIKIKARVSPTSEFDSPDDHNICDVRSDDDETVLVCDVDIPDRIALPVLDDKRAGGCLNRARLKLTSIYRGTRSKGYIDSYLQQYRQESVRSDVERIGRYEQSIKRGV
ncbi:hypothetical protein CDD80_3097 [Ophiocordyceps camponoti-rufipedis]|uniref:AA1-like domain-containing protein n=1 Tax=Ophiocordyceps camponoti-rufipedis TaxID=2004952 RepID=A0A2C5Z3X3_9HYPO|nr:hypothetical protein CDD80_3097 [Ophiocordyceps camponoti-rufipedis]